jgi:hypothetical protein
MATKPKKLSKAEMDAISRPRGGTVAVADAVVNDEDDGLSPRRRHGKTYTLLLTSGDEIIFDTDLTRAEVAVRYPKSKIIKEVPYLSKNREKATEDDI